MNDVVCKWEKPEAPGFDGYIYVLGGGSGKDVKGFGLAKGMDRWTGAWISASSYYWPKQGKLSFLAVAQYQPETSDTTPEAWATPSTEDAKGLTSTEKTFPTDGTQPDWLFSDIAKDKTGSNCVPGWNLNGNTGTKNRTAEGVQLNMRHALSWITFTKRTAEEYEDFEIKITSMKLTGMKVKGSFSQNLDTESPAWTPAEDAEPEEYQLLLSENNQPIPVDVENSNEAKSFITDATNQEIYPLIVMPQTFTDSTKLVIDYTIKGAGENDEAVPQTITIVLNEKKEDGTTNKYCEGQFKMGSKYTFNLIFSFDKVYFSPEVTDWQTETAIDVTNEYEGVLID